LLPKIVFYLGFQSFGLERHLMKVIPEMCCAH